jgi:DNA repair protein RadC
LLKKGPSLIKKWELYGEAHLSNEELWALFWENGRQNLGEAKAQLDAAGGFSSLIHSSFDPMTSKLKYSKKKVFLWKIFQEIVKREATFTKKHILNKPEKIFDLVKGDFLGKNIETCMVIGRNKNKECMFKEEIGSGDSQKVFCQTRDIFRSSLLYNVEEFILVHNHSSPFLAPSKEDLITTKTIQKIGTLLGMEMIDHLIVHEENFLSLYQLGYLRQRESY